MKTSIATVMILALCSASLGCKSASSSAEPTKADEAAQQAVGSLSVDPSAGAQSSPAEQADDNAATKEAKRRGDAERATLALAAVMTQPPPPSLPLDKAKELRDYVLTLEHDYQVAHSRQLGTAIALYSYSVRDDLADMPKLEKLVQEIVVRHGLHEDAGLLKKFPNPAEFLKHQAEAGIKQGFKPEGK